MPFFLDPVNEGSKRKSADVNLGASSSKRRREGDIQGEGSSSTNELYWMVQWRLPQYKKNKTWDGDGVIVLNGSSCKLFDDTGTLLGTTIANIMHVESGTNLIVNNRDVELDHEISRDDFTSGRCFSNGFSFSVAPRGAPAHSSFASLTKEFVQLKPVGPSLSNSKSSSVSGKSRGIPLYPINLLSTSSSPPSVTNDSAKVITPDSYWTANWRKPQQKKHKTWDGDAYVTCTRGGKLQLISESGNILGEKQSSDGPLHSGYRTYIGAREVELDVSIPKAQIPEISCTSVDDHVPLDAEYQFPGPRTAKSWLPRMDDLAHETPKSLTVSTPTTVAPASFYSKVPQGMRSGPLHNPDAEGAVVMKTPTKEHQAKFNRRNSPVVPVVIDPLLTRRLRPHQIEGVKFLYECVMGLRKHEGQGCILADDMGLGKTLQTITLIWTLIKQNPYSSVVPLVGKALIVCPVSLLNNWKAEFYKWLGRDRVGILVGDKDKNHVKQFINSRQQVLIIGYEKLRTVIHELSFCSPPIGLIICDEGHRLKSANNKTSKMFETLKTPRRIILSGTPIQNDLSEFHTMANFCNPGLLDDSNTFRRVYEIPILKSRTPDCTQKEKELGEARGKQLLHIAQSFVLRREATILKKYLPPKYEYLVFITPTQLQLNILSKILSKDKLDRFIANSVTESLVLIGMLQKICNSPILLKATADKIKSKENHGGDVTKNIVHEALEYLPNKVQIEDVTLSGKLTALSYLLRTIRKNTDEKVVIVSHWTSTLNIVEAFCKKQSYTYFRLDGSTPSQKRQEYVNDFNRSSQGTRFLFLLSSKAGGVGINLIGASRLCLIDCDWNPSHDLQSMARIHRDGQKRPVYIYRFLTAGTIDEKIFQRQVTKLGLSASVIGTDSTESKSKSDSFTPKELRDIFTIHPNTGSHTHDLLDCPCEGATKVILSDPEEVDDFDDDINTRSGFVNASQMDSAFMEKLDRAYMLKKKTQLASLGEWTHINGLVRNAQERVKDDILGMMLHKFKDGETVDTTSRPGNQTRLQNLFDATDIDNVSAAVTNAKHSRLGVRDVPGGTISFLFEKCSNTVVEEAEDD